MRCYFMILIALLLAACGGGSPTATLPAPTSAPESTENANVTVAPIPTDMVLNIIGVTLPPPGTLVMAPVTEDPYAGTLFYSLQLTRTGGPGDTELTVRLLPDGTLTRGPLSITVSEAEVIAIDTLLDTIRFFDINGTFSSINRSPDTYTYIVTLESPAGGRSIISDDQLTPPELRMLFDAILALGIDTPEVPPEIATGAPTAETPAP